MPSGIADVDIMQLLLWEGLLANWGVVGNSESDIAIEEFDPYNSHYIYEILLSVYRDHKKGQSGDLVEAMLKEMWWPEWFDFPLNPPDTLRNFVKHWLKRTGLFHSLKKLRYRFDRWRFRRLSGPSQEKE